MSWSHSQSMPQTEPASEPVSASVGEPVPARVPVTMNQLSPQLLKDSSRIDVDSLMNEFKQELGPDRWENYRDSLTHFLMGKLSRAELVRCLREQLGLNGASMRNHNTLLLSLLANACREAPPGAESSLADWKANTRNKNRHSGMDASNDLLHKEILTLPVRERRRIKNIAKEATNYLRDPIFPLPSVDMESMRHAMLPRIPLAQDHNSVPSSGANNNANASGNTANHGTSGGLLGSAAGRGAATNANTAGSAATNGSVGGAAVQNGVRKDKEKDTNPLMDPLLNLHPGRTSGPLTWTQDIIQGLDTPLISESHELPDETTLATRMLSLALENGVLGGIGPGTTDIMLLGLESYFRSIIDQLFELRHRNVTSADPLNAADFNLLADLRPGELGDRSAPLLRLKSSMLQDDETDTEDEAHSDAQEEDTPVEDPSTKRTNPWNLEQMRGSKRPKPEESEKKKKALEEHQRGIALVDELLS